MILFGSDYKQSRLSLFAHFWLTMLKNVFMFLLLVQVNPRNRYCISHIFFLKHVCSLPVKGFHLPTCLQCARSMWTRRWRKLCDVQNYAVGLETRIFSSLFLILVSYQGGLLQARSSYSNGLLARDGSSVSHRSYDRLQHKVSVSHNPCRH